MIIVIRELPFVKIILQITFVLDANLTIFLHPEQPLAIVHL
jgi:hypothetical protein